MTSWTPTQQALEAISEAIGALAWHVERVGELDSDAKYELAGYLDKVRTAVAASRQEQP